MSDSLIATEDSGLSAIVVSRTPLRYDAGADASLDRPSHVRAGSSLAQVPGGLALVQDDANFVAVVECEPLRVRAIPLPVGPGGVRQFDDLRGNKAHKLDLEACVAVRAPDGVLLLAFGSGSTPARELVAVVAGWERDEAQVHVRHVPHLYDLLRREREFAGSELNIEGAVNLGGRLRLFGRGNGAPRDGLQPVNATCDLDLETLLGHLDDPDRRPPPAPLNVVRYELGALGGVPLGFTDAACWHGGLIYTATAEQSPDATRDGPVTGSVVGIIDLSSNGGARCTPLVDATGALFRGKVEGVATESHPTARLYVVVDADDPAAPSELCQVELRGRGWRVEGGK